MIKLKRANSQNLKDKNQNQTEKRVQARPESKIMGHTSNRFSKLIRATKRFDSSDQSHESENEKRMILEVDDELDTMASSKDLELKPKKSIKFGNKAFQSFVKNQNDSFDSVTLMNSINTENGSIATSTTSAEPEDSGLSKLRKNLRRNSPRKTGATDSVVTGSTSTTVGITNTASSTTIGTTNNALSNVPKFEPQPDSASDYNIAPGKNVINLNKVMDELEFKLTSREIGTVRWCWSENNDMIATTKFNDQMEDGKSGGVGNANDKHKDKNSVSTVYLPSFSATFQSADFWRNVAKYLENNYYDTYQLLPPIKHFTKSFSSIIRMCILNLNDLTLMKDYFFKLGRVHERLFSTTNDSFNDLLEAINTCLYETYGDFYTMNVEKLWMGLLGFVSACMLVTCEEDSMVEGSGMQIRKKVHKF